MKEQIIEIIERKNGSIDFKDSKYYDIGSSLPRLESGFVFDTFGWQFKGSIDWVGSDHTSSNTYLVDISVWSSENVSFESVEISFKGAFEKLFFGENISVEYPNKDFAEELKNKEEFLQISNLVDKSAYFSPLIEGEKTSVGYKISTGFRMEINETIQLEAVLDGLLVLTRLIIMKHSEYKGFF